MAAADLKGHMLIVDDEPDVRRLLAEKLSLEGFQCSDCSSGDEALALIEHQPFEVVISDLRMPGISGLEFLKVVRQKHPHSAFLMATATDDIRVAITAMKEGADDYLLKPFQLDAVVACVRRALEKKRLELEVETYRKHLEEIVQQRTKQIQLTYDQTLDALAAALDLRDNDTAGHSRRVTRYCLEMAKAMNCSGEQLKQIERGAYLHDIGKIGIPDSILLKPGKLTPEEWDIMESHARIGYELVSRIAFLEPAAEIVLTHQERFDGGGYPQGLTGEQIPLGARIFAVADTLDAMTSDRPYRKALPLSAAREEIIRESGRQFDPEVVRVFLKISEETWKNIREEVARLSVNMGPDPSAVTSSDLLGS